MVIKITKKVFPIVSLLIVFTLVQACSSRNYNLNEERLTVAKAQREIKIGMSASEVLDVLGSPNMITTDDKRRETWVYDRVSTTVQASSSRHGVWVLFYDYSNRNSLSSSTQRTLTIIVKFDNQSKVRDFAYRTSAF
ncbi:MAG: hypothetical protein ACOX3T_05835 [Bdellovibrionota bacterium]